MKKIMVVLSSLVVAALVLSAFSISVAYAAEPTPTPSTPGVPGYGSGMMNRRGGGFGRGIMGFNGSNSPLHPSMISAMAEALGLTVDELNARLAAGETPWQIAQAQGLTIEQFGELMIKARTNAINKAVADGLISQEWANWMLSRMQQRWQNGLGFGRFRGACGGSLWGANPTPTP